MMVFCVCLPEFSVIIVVVAHVACCFDCAIAYCRVLGTILKIHARTHRQRRNFFTNSQKRLDLMRVAILHLILPEL